LEDKLPEIHKFFDSKIFLGYKIGSLKFKFKAQFQKFKDIDSYENYFEKAQKSIFWYESLVEKLANSLNQFTKS
jgi:hypothetical protein